jgi:hypothetical protein
MKEKIRFAYDIEDGTIKMYGPYGEPIDPLRLSVAYNTLVEKYNNLYHELAEYLPYASPDMPVDAGDQNPDAMLHERCADFKTDLCLINPCPDCDLSLVE